MATKKTKKYITKEIDGSYIGMVPPKLDFFKVNLVSNLYIEESLNTGEQKVISQNYIIKINNENISKSFQQVLSNDLKGIFKMDFASYNWANKEFKYYTSRYVNDEDKITILQNIFDYLEAFEKDYVLFKEKNEALFNKEKENFETHIDSDYVIKYSKKLDNIVVISLSFLGSDNYRLLAGSSSKTLKVNELKENEIDDDFFNGLDIKALSKKTCFLIKPENYQNIKSIVEKSKIEEELFLQEQTKIEEVLGDEIDSYTYTDENIFNFRIVPNREKKCFEFSLRGYYNAPSSFTMQYGNNYAQKGLLSQWALDLIASEYVKQEELDFEKYTSESDISLPGYYKILMRHEKDRSIKTDIINVPFSEIESIKKIYNNFLEQNKLVEGKPVKSIKIEHLNGVNYRSSGPSIGENLNSFPSIYISEKNKIFLIYKMTNISSKVSVDKKTGNEVEKPGYLSMKGVEISYEAMLDLLENHPYADKLLSNTKFLNTEARVNANNSPSSLTIKEREIVWDTISLALEFAEQDKKAPKTRNKVVKI